MVILILKSQIDGSLKMGYKLHRNIPRLFRLQPILLRRVHLLKRPCHLVHRNPFYALVPVNPLDELLVHEDVVWMAGGIGVDAT
jgi:hypothetical protein